MMSPLERIIQECWKVALRENRASIALFKRKLSFAHGVALAAILELEARGLITKAPELDQSRHLRISSFSRATILGREFQPEEFPS
jgi:hypothetical protein